MGRGVFVASVFSLFAGIAYAQAADYPDSLQTRVALFFHQAGMVRLHAAVDRYSASRSNPAARQNFLASGGLSSEDAEQVVSRYRVATLPPITWVDGTATLRAPNVTLTVGPEEAWSRTLLINGRPFHWQHDRPLAENLNRYDALFLSTRAYFSLLPDAWAADEVLSLKAAGLQIYFILAATGERSETLLRLNQQVKEMTRLCQLPESGRDDPFTDAVMKSTAQAQKFSSRLSFKNCADISTYATQSGASPRGSAASVKDLCASLDRLALCMRRTMNPGAVTRDGQKKPQDASEWHEPTQPAFRSEGAPAK